MQETDTSAAAPETPVPAKRAQPGLNDMAEDIFGLSLRGLSTIWETITKPAIVFTAARTPDWNQRYTPSLRLVTSIIAVMMLLRIFWAAESSSMYQMIVAQLEQVAEQMPEFEDTENLVEIYFNTWALVFPLGYLALHFLFSLFTRIWGKGASLVTRVRLYFVALVPALVFAVFSVLLMPAVPMGSIAVVTTGGMAISLVLYMLTAFFGLRSAYPSMGARLWRALLFGVIVSLADLLSSLLSNFAAGIWIGITALGGS